MLARLLALLACCMVGRGDSVVSREKPTRDSVQYEAVPWMEAFPCFELEVFAKSRYSTVPFRIPHSCSAEWSRTRQGRSEKELSALPSLALAKPSAGMPYLRSHRAVSANDEKFSQLRASYADIPNRLCS